MWINPVIKSDYIGYRAVTHKPRYIARYIGFQIGLVVKIAAKGTRESKMCCNLLSRHKKSRTLRISFYVVWCPEEDLNLHALASTST